MWIDKEMIESRIKELKESLITVKENTTMVQQQLSNLNITRFSIQGGIVELQNLLKEEEEEEE